MYYVLISIFWLIFRNFKIGCHVYNIPNYLFLNPYRSDKRVHFTVICFNFLCLFSTFWSNKFRAQILALRLDPVDELNLRS